jgi:hypothetical protein
MASIAHARDHFAYCHTTYEHSKELAIHFLSARPSSFFLTTQLNFFFAPRAARRALFRGGPRDSQYGDEHDATAALRVSAA